MNQEVVSHCNVGKLPAPRPGISICVDWRFWVWWVLANAAGIGLGIAIGYIGAGGPLTTTIRVILWAAVGAIVGMMQRLVLQQAVYPDKWVWASVAGWTVGGILAGRNGIDWVVMGSMVGLMQWSVLRHHVHQAGWWVLANAAGLVIGAIIGWSTTFNSKWTLFMRLTVEDESIIQVINWLVAGVVGGTVNGMITGLWLFLLLPLKRRS